MAQAVVHPNIALVKYWGKRDQDLNLPSTGSVSMTVSTFETRTRVMFGVPDDLAVLNGRTARPDEAVRIFEHLDRVVPGRRPAQVVSDNNFPSAAGLASSSSAFAALTVAAADAAGLEFTPRALSALARQGSGSASRSIWGGFVEWQRGSLIDGSDSHGVQIAPASHWDLRLVVAVVDSGRKPIGSRAGMNRTMATSPMYAAWVASYMADVKQARQGILDRDLEAVGDAMERSTLKMFSTMLTSVPPVRYWKPASLALQDAVYRLRDQGVPVWWTMDAGPNVKALTTPEHADTVRAAFEGGCEAVHVLGVGGPPRLEP